MTPAKRPRDIAAMFDKVAARYDITNDVLSLGQDRLWRRAVARAVGHGPGERVLDLAAGTGASSIALTRRDGHCVACDFSLGMLTKGARRHAPRRDTRRREPAPRLSFVAGDALRLPFGDGAFDAVTISFGLRNVADPRAALEEMRRVARPGGRLVVCEFSVPPWRPFRALHQGYLSHVLPRLAALVSSDPGAYTYLVDSIGAWPDQAELARTLHAAGWERVTWRNLSGGVVAIHRAIRW